MWLWLTIIQEAPLAPAPSPPRPVPVNMDQILYMDEDKDGRAFLFHAAYNRVLHVGEQRTAIAEFLMAAQIPSIPLPGPAIDEEE